MKTGYIKLIIKLIIVIVLPLTAGTLIGVYAYDTYQTGYFYKYMNNASDSDTEDRFISYLKYETENLEYSKENGEYEFFLKEDVKDQNDEVIFTFSIIRSSQVVEDVAQYGKNNQFIGREDEYYITYHMAMYNINWDKLALALDSSGEHPLAYDKLPTIEFVLIDRDQEEEDKQEKVLTSTTVASQIGGNTLVAVYDYGYSPKRDAEGNKLNADNPTSMRYYALTGVQINALSQNQDLVVRLKENWDKDTKEEDKTTADIAVKSFDNLYSNNHIKKGVKDGDTVVVSSDEIKKELKQFSEAYNKDIFKAGYSKYVFATYIWWEALIAIILFEVVCGSFVLVWNAEEQKAMKKNKSKK